MKDFLHFVKMDGYSAQIYHVVDFHSKASNEGLAPLGMRPTLADELFAKLCSRKGLIEQIITYVLWRITLKQNFLIHFNGDIYLVFTDSFIE